MAALLGYLLGSIPAGYVAGRIAGIDIRTAGSGNIGATNVLRVLGKKYGYPVFAFDVIKGVAAVLVAKVLTRGAAGVSDDFAGIIGGVAAVIGHSFPLWLRFRGGKGVATSLGVLFALIPLAAIIMVAVWAMVFFSTRYVSVASICAAGVLPVAGWIVVHRRGGGHWSLLYFSVVIAVLVIWRHRTNIVRLWQGSEPRFQRK